MSHVQFETEDRVSVPYFRPMNDGKIATKITRDDFVNRAVKSGIPTEEVERRLKIEFDRDTPPFTLVGDNARARYWTTPAGKGVAFEQTCSAISGHIVAVKFNEHPEYGQSINVTLRQPSGAEAIYAMSTKGQYATNFMEKLPNVNLDESVKFSAYVRESGDKKSYHSMIYQGDTNVQSFFKKWNDDKKAFDLSNGYPEVNEKEQKKFGSDYFSTRYYPEVKVFLVEYIKQNVAPKVNELVQVVQPSNSDAEEDVTIVDDVPF